MYQLSSDSGYNRQTVEVHSLLSTAVVHSFVFIIPDRQTQKAGYSLLLAFLNVFVANCVYHVKAA